MPNRLVMPLYETAMMIRGMGSTLGNERPEELDLSDDEIEVRKGIGLVLQILADRLRGITRALDEYLAEKGSRHE